MSSGAVVKMELPENEADLADMVKAWHCHGNVGFMGLYVCLCACMLWQGLKEKLASASEKKACLLHSD